jgi:hypothetical protein
VRKGRKSSGKGGDSLDLLAHQDGALMALFAELDESHGPAVLDRYNHGNQGKRLIRHISLREAAKADLVHALAGIPELAAIRQQLMGEVEERRKAINALDLMGRGVRPIDLNKTQDFNAAIDDLRQVVVPEISWELAEGIPTIDRSLSQDQRTGLHSAHYVRRHAPTKLDPTGFRRREGRHIVGWILTRWDHLLDRPRPVKGARVD